MIKCTQCSSKNINEAQFCRKCGRKLTNEEKENKKNGLIYSLLNFWDLIIHYITLEFITDHIIFKIFAIVIILGVGIFNIVNNGLNMKIKDSDSYKLQYNTESKVYYLISPTEQTTLHLYIPSRAKETNIQLYNENNEIIKETRVEQDKGIVLDENEAGNYYIIEADYGNNNMDRIKLFVYKEDSGEV